MVNLGNKRKIFCISMIKNEADIIESFIRYHQFIFDGMVILDNNSTDNTIKILRKLQDEGLNIHIIEDVSYEFSQGRKTSKLLSDVFLNYSPDLIFPLDADEFIIAYNGILNPREIIEELDLKKIYYLKWKTYVPSSLDNE